MKRHTAARTCGLILTDSLFPGGQTSAENVISMNIEIIKKPDWISLEQITEVLHDAHTTTADNGMHFLAYSQTVEDTRRRLGDDGLFYVALCDGELAGCAAVVFHPKSSKWYCTDKEYAEIKMVAVRNQFKGLGINNSLYRALEEHAFSRCNLVVMNTAEDNRIVVDSNLRHGWKIIDYLSWRYTDYYSVIMGKWKKCPYTDRYINFRYRFRRLQVRIAKDKNGKYRIPLLK